MKSIKLEVLKTLPKTRTVNKYIKLMKESNCSEMFLDSDLFENYDYYENKYNNDKLKRRKEMNEKIRNLLI